ncbi:MAG: retropepsin-like aspartic protease [Bacteroidota bacterium]
MKLLIIIGLLLSSQVMLMAQDRCETVEIAVMQDQPIVRGTINGKEAFFLVDTGSDVSLIHAKDAKRYGFFCHPRRALDRFQLYGLGTSIKELTAVHNMYVQLGSRTIFADYIALDLSTIIHSLNTGTSIEISGILGSKTLNKYGFVIDYHRNEIIMNPPGTE